MYTCRTGAGTHASARADGMRCSATADPEAPAALCRRKRSWQRGGPAPAARADVNLKDEVRAGSRVFVFLRGDVDLFSCGGDCVCVCGCVHTYMYTCIYILYGSIRYHIMYAYIYISCILHKHTVVYVLFLQRHLFCVCAHIYRCKT